MCLVAFVGQSAEDVLLSDICRRAVIGGTLESVAGSRITSAFMSLRSSSSWLRTTKMSIIKTCQVVETNRSRQDLVVKLNMYCQ